MCILGVAWAAFEIGSSIMDGYSTISVWNDRCASVVDKWLTTGLFAVGLVAPGGGGATAYRAFARGRWLDHFVLHGAEFGYKNSMEYLRGAQSLTRGGGNVLTHTRKNGDQLFYNPGTNEFAVLRKDGRTIRTYFRSEGKVLILAPSNWQEVEKWLVVFYLLVMSIVS